jgi:hypothetical protein
MEKTYSIADKAASAALFSYEDLLGSLDDWHHEHRNMPAKLVLSPALYERMNRWEGQPSGVTMQTFYGMPILIDPSLKHGEWRFEAKEE